MNRQTKRIRFTADLHSCINHRCSAEVIIGETGELLEVIWWSDGHSDSEEVSDKIWNAIAESIEI